MARSKLEMYVDILHVMALKGPTKLSHIMHKVNINHVVLKEALDFLIKQGLVGEILVGKRKLFAATPRGVTAVKYFREINQALPIIEEAQGPPPFYKH